MPLEIRELVIKVDIQAVNQTPQPNTDNRLEALKSQIIDECLTKVLSRLENLLSR